MVYLIQRFQLLFRPRLVIYNCRGLITEPLPNTLKRILILIPGQTGIVSGQLQVISRHPNVEIVVLPSPAPVLVGESIHLSELIH